MINTQFTYYTLFTYFTLYIINVYYTLYTMQCILAFIKSNGCISTYTLVINYSYTESNYININKYLVK